MSVRCSFSYTSDRFAAALEVPSRRNNDSHVYEESAFGVRTGGQKRLAAKDLSADRLGQPDGT